MFYMHRPTQHKMDQPDNFTKIEMTYDSPEYNPEDETHENIERELCTQLNNDLDIVAGDVAAAYLNAPVGEKAYFRCRPEFGSLQGCLAILTKALYGLKTSARAWRLHL